MDDKAIEVMRSMAAYLGNAKTLRFKVETWEDEVTESGILLKRGKRGEVTLKRPDKISAVTETDDGEKRKACFDGKSLLRLIENENTYVKIDFEGETDALLDYLIDTYDLELPLADFLYNDLAAAFRQYIISAEYVGERIIGGAKCHHPVV